MIRSKLNLAATPPLIVLVGPTASGKTALAVQIAKMCRGEIICADSRTVYREMNVGTAKPTHEEQQGVPHWGLDMVDPDKIFSAADFQRYAQEKINDIRARGGMPIVAGGTGLYVDGLIYSYEFAEKGDARQREAFESMSLDELYDYCHKNNIELPQNYKNKRYVVRAIEQGGINKQRRGSILSNTIVVGIATEKDVLRTRIEYRIEQMLQHGVVEEARILGKKYGWKVPSMTGNIYPLVNDYLNKKLTLQEMQQKAVSRDWRLAKRQLTWFRRNKDIVWVDIDSAPHYLGQELARWITS